MSAVGRPTITDELKAGVTINGRDYHNHLDGYDFMPYLTGEVDQGPRETFYYWSDDGLLTAMRVGDWKVVFAEQRAKEFDVWREQLTPLGFPRYFICAVTLLSAPIKTRIHTTIGGCGLRYPESGLQGRRYRVSWRH